MIFWTHLLEQFRFANACDIISNFAIQYSQRYKYARKTAFLQFTKFRDFYGLIKRYRIFKNA